MEYFTGGLPGSLDSEISGLHGRIADLETEVKKSFKKLFILNHILSLVQGAM